MPPESDSGVRHAFCIRRNMPRFRRHVLTGIAAGAVAVGTSVLSGQVPPPRELHAYVLVDVGDVPVPLACPCIARPFTVPAAEIVPGDASGPGGPRAFGEPTEAELRRHNRQKAEDLARYAANVEDGLAGDSGASFGLAMLFTAGHAVPRNDEEAARWLELAARQGHSDAPLQLGHRYHRGLGVPQSDEAAAYWLMTGANAGDRLAMVALGLLHAAGRGVVQDWSLATAWWQRADAASRTPLASRLLGDAYACGLGVAQDHRRAVTSYRAAAAGGETSAYVQLGHLYARQCTPGGDEAAFAAYKRAADVGDVEAQIALSDLLLHGRGVDPDLWGAYFWATMARQRTPPGPLLDQANASAAAAARSLPAFLIEDAERMVKEFMPASTHRELPR
jgi:uncharacterized protein